jgi:hypothetical protein
LARHTNILDNAKQPLFDPNLHDNRDTGRSELHHERRARWDLDVVAQLEVLGEHLGRVEGFNSVAFEDLRGAQISK